MDFQPTEDQRAYRDTAERFAPECLAETYLERAQVHAFAARSRADLAEMKRLERDAALRALPSEDVAKGLDAFENRTPNFKE